MGQQELFTLAVAIAGVMIVGRAVARRLEIPDAIVLVVLGVLVGLIPHGYLPVRRARPATCRCGVRAPRCRRVPGPPAHLPTPVTFLCGVPARHTTCFPARLPICSRQSQSSTRNSSMRYLAWRIRLPWRIRATPVAQSLRLSPILHDNGEPVH